MRIFSDRNFLLHPDIGLETRIRINYRILRFEFKLQGSIETTMMKRSFLLALIFAGILFSGQKPEAPLNIKLKMKGIKDTTIYLATYFGDKVLRVDSLRLNHEGVGILTRDKLQKEGIFLFYLNDKNYFEFLLGKNQKLSIEADFSNNMQNKFSGAEGSPLPGFH